MSTIDEYYGGSLFGMKGKDCVAICTDMRLGNSFQTQVMNMPKVEQVSKYGLVGLSVFIPDAIEFHRRIKYEAEIYRLNEGREIRAPQLTRLISSMLYEKRTTHGWYVAPIVAGIDDTGSPYLATMDGLGATTDGDAWVSAGTASTYMLGPAQYLYKDGFTKEELLKTCTEVMQSSVNRDAFSGWGIKIYLIDKSGVSIYDVPCRMD